MNQVCGRLKKVPESWLYEAAWGRHLAAVSCRPGQSSGPQSGKSSSEILRSQFSFGPTLSLLEPLPSWWKLSVLNPASQAAFFSASCFQTWAGYLQTEAEGYAINSVNKDSHQCSPRTQGFTNKGQGARSGSLVWKVSYLVATNNAFPTGIQGPAETLSFCQAKPHLKARSEKVTKLCVSSSSWHWPPSLATKAAR